MFWRSLKITGEPARHTPRCSVVGCLNDPVPAIRRALDEGDTTPKKVASDLAFASLRDNPDFKLLLASQKSAKAEQSR